MHYPPIPRLHPLGQSRQHHQFPGGRSNAETERRVFSAHLVPDWRACQRHQHGGVLQAGSEGTHQRVSVRLVSGRRAVSCQQHAVVW